MLPTPSRPSLRRGLIAGALTLCASAGVAAEDAASSEAEPFLQATVPSIEQLQAHYQESPYAKLAQTQWAQFGTTMATAQAEQAQPGALAALQSITSLALAMEMDMMAPSVAAWVHTADAQALVDLILAEEQLTPVEGQEATWTDDSGTTLQKVGADLLKIAQGAAQLDEPRLDAAEGDLNLHIAYGSLVEMMEAMGQADQAALEMMKDMVIDMQVTLAPIGVREHVVTSGMGGVDGWAQWAQMSAKRELLESLPADTLWATTSSIPAGMMKAWLEGEQAQEMLANPGVAQINMMLAGWGLPDYPTMIAAVGGDNLIYARTSAPFPALTMQLGIDEEIGRQVLDAIAQQAGWQDAGDGSYQGLVGFSPIFGAYADGHLVITTHPGGIAAHTDREPGFFTNETIQAALAEIPEGRTLQVIGLSRSGDWWGSLADLGAPFAAQSGIPGIALLGQDLRQAFSYGFLWSSMGEDGTTEMASGGPLGGIMTQSMAVGIGAGAAFFVQQMGAAMGGGMQGGGFDDAQ